jgi:hypothetical protein
MQHYEDHVKPYIVREFAFVLGAITHEASLVLNLLRRHIGEGGEVSYHWLKTGGHLDRIYHTADHHTLQAVERVSSVTAHAQQTAIHAAVQDLSDEIDDDDLDDDDVDDVVQEQQQSVGKASNGEKLIVFFSHVPRVVRQQLEEKVPAALTGPQEATQTLLQRGLDEAVAAGLQRTLTIARTEVANIYRDTLHKTAQTVQTLIGWYWTARSDCCVACGAMHGTFHDMREGLDSHPRCRCYPRYVYRKEQVQTGEERFATLAEDRQKEILGQKKFELYQAGKIRLTDCVVKTRSQDWGPGIREASVDEALAHAAKRSQS